LAAALEAAMAGREVAVVSKVFPTRSHSVAAQGGTAAALGSMGVILVWSYAVGFIVIVTPSVVSAVAAIVRGPDS